MYFEFVPFGEIDERSEFANRVCKLLYEKHNGDLDKASEEGKPFFSGMEEFIRNIYELVETEIPLYAYHRLQEYGPANYGFDEVEYKTALNNVKKACIDYYE